VHGLHVLLELAVQVADLGEVLADLAERVEVCDLVEIPCEELRGCLLDVTQLV
jgi:hypothetical protein